MESSDVFRTYIKATYKLHIPLRFLMILPFPTLTSQPNKWTSVAALRKASPTSFEPALALILILSTAFWQVQ